VLCETVSDLQYKLDLFSKSFIMKHILLLAFAQFALSQTTATEAPIVPVSANAPEAGEPTKAQTVVAPQPTVSPPRVTEISKPEITVITPPSQTSPPAPPISSPSTNPVPPPGNSNPPPAGNGNTTPPLVVPPTNPTVPGTPPSTGNNQQGNPQPSQTNQPSQPIGPAPSSAPPGAPQPVPPSPSPSDGPVLSNGEYDSEMSLAVFFFGVALLL
jgi:hypothetical protein